MNGKPRKTKVRIVGDPLLVDKVAEALETYFETDRKERKDFDIGAGRPEASNKPIKTTYLTILKEADVATSTWTVEDVRTRAYERNIQVSDDQADEILRELDHHQDASVGINWDVLDSWIDSVVPNPKPIKTERDYVYCKTCKMFVDFWKYDFDIDEAGHKGHDWRHVTLEELEQCVIQCGEDGCFEESRLC